MEFWLESYRSVENLPFWFTLTGLYMFYIINIYIGQYTVYTGQYAV